MNTFCEHIQAYMKNPLKINAERSILSKIAIGALAVLGGAAVAYIGTGCAFLSLCFNYSII